MRSIHTVLKSYCMHGFKFEDNSSMVLLNSTGDCERWCPGDKLIFECAVEGRVATVWQEIALEFDNSYDEIVFFHSRFNTSTSSSCSNEAVVGMSIGVENNLYISQLVVRIKDRMNMSQVKCVRDDGNRADLIGQQNFTIGIYDVILYEYFNTLCLK